MKLEEFNSVTAVMMRDRGWLNVSGIVPFQDPENGSWWLLFNELREAG
ncbi:hypothetical protein ACF087_34820 [Streptomyces goshikiensis]